MMRQRSTYAVAAALVATLAVAGCKKQETAPEATAPPPPSPALEPSAPVAPVAATASVTGVELGTAVGADMNVTAPSTTFAPGDTIIAAVSTATSDPAATVNGTLGARWTFGGDTVVHEESKEIAFAGKGVTNFQISKPDGWPAGSYKLEVTLDGATVETRDFEVK
ncbi:hypothetical protein [Marilutibacter chinensis]|uniref:Uncharacterized protein n=1 Tax=Marilutibacter chinensis TaxID=2912247 RepID=A0ABS9HTN4_9GAMM|nr:hypothetical protein [Lysobacter chinensis]MCF7221712.1 hypothetical protein [Lysobacter chinensis]